METKAYTVSYISTIGGGVRNIQAPGKKQAVEIFHKECGKLAKIERVRKDSWFRDEDIDYDREGNITGIFLGNKKVEGYRFEFSTPAQGTVTVLAKGKRDAKDIFHQLYLRYALITSITATGGTPTTQATYTVIKRAKSNSTRIRNGKGTITTVGKAR